MHGLSLRATTVALVAVVAIGLSAAGSSRGSASRVGASVVKVSLRDSPDPVSAGTKLTYTARVRNATAAQTSPVTLYFMMRDLPADPISHKPVSPEFVAGSAGRHACRKLEQIFSCALGRLAAGHEVTALFVVVPRIATVTPTQFAADVYTHVAGEPYGSNSNAIQYTRVRP